MSVLIFYRDIARMLANDYNKRVMIVDTSNEIGGDGDIPHAGIGSARRMQVPNSDAQHKVRAFTSILMQLLLNWMHMLLQLTIGEKAEELNYIFELVNYLWVSCRGDDRNPMSIKTNKCVIKARHVAESHIQSVLCQTKPQTTPVMCCHAAHENPHSLCLLYILESINFLINRISVT